MSILSKGKYKQDCDFISCGVSGHLTPGKYQLCGKVLFGLSDFPAKLYVSFLRIFGLIPIPYASSSSFFFFLAQFKLILT